MALTLADSRTRLDIFTTAPLNWEGGQDPVQIEIGEFANAIEATCWINKPDYRLSATASDTVPDQPMCLEGNATTFAASNYEGNLTVLRSLDSQGQIDSLTDVVFAAIGEKGTLNWYAERIGPKSETPIAVGDEGWLYYALSDNP